MPSAAPNRLVSWAAILMIASLLVCMRSFLMIKLALVALFLAMSYVGNLGKRITIDPQLLYFYLSCAILGTVWGLVGLLSRNYAQGNLDGIKLYVLWSVAFFVLYTLLRRGDSLKVFHLAMLLAGFLIPLYNLLGLVYPEVFTDPDMVMVAGNEHGVWQFSSSNIASLFIVAPYLLSLQLIGKTTIWAKLSLLLSLAMVAFSGRRALWMVTALTPLLVLAFSRIAKRAIVRPKLLASAFLTVAAVGFALTSLENGAAERFQQAFSGDDYRTIQGPYLIKAFQELPMLGSGFGGRAEYIRNDQQPWQYELTYQKMLFNLGIIGTTAIVSLFGVYLWLAIRALRQHSGAIPFALLIGLVSLLIGAYSNPYLGGFDSLFFVGLLPLVSTFRNGASRELRCNQWKHRTLLPL